MTIIAVGVAVLVIRPRLPSRGSMVISALTVLALGLSAQYLLSTNFGLTHKILADSINGQTARTQVVHRVLIDASQKNPMSVVWGVGPGQFSSRAGLIGTGLYFGGPLHPQHVPFLPTGISEYQSEYLMDLWYGVASVNYYGSSYAPFFSWLSVYSEFGIAGLLVVAVGFGALLVKCVRTNRSDTQQAWTCVYVLSAAIFLLLLGAQGEFLGGATSHPCRDDACQNCL